MKIAMFHSNHDNTKPSRNKTGPEPISKLSRLFKKLNTATKHHDHQYPYKHALTKAGKTDLTPFTKSGTRLPVANYDKDKMFEQRRYHGTMQPTDVNTGNHKQDKSLLESSHSISGRSSIHRPPLTTSPSLNEIARCSPCRPSHINSNRNNHHQQSYDLTRHSAEVIPTQSTFSTDITSIISKCHDNDTSCDTELYSNDDKGDNLTNTSHEKTDYMQLQIWDSAFWNESSSALTPGRRIQPQPIPAVMHELRRINTISNDDLDKRCHHHTLRRNQSYVVRKGRFEISIEPSNSRKSESRNYDSRQSVTLDKP